MKQNTNTRTKVFSLQKRAVMMLLIVVVSVTAA